MRRGRDVPCDFFIFPSFPSCGIVILLIHTNFLRGRKFVFLGHDPVSCVLYWCAFSPRTVPVTHLDRFPAFVALLEAVLLGTLGTECLLRRPPQNRPPKGESLRQDPLNHHLSTRKYENERGLSGH